MFCYPYTLVSVANSLLICTLKHYVCIFRTFLWLVSYLASWLHKHFGSKATKSICWTCVLSVFRSLKWSRSASLRLSLSFHSHVALLLLHSHATKINKLTSLKMLSFVFMNICSLTPCPLPTNSVGGITTAPYVCCVSTGGSFPPLTSVTYDFALSSSSSS